MSKYTERNDFVIGTNQEKTNVIFDNILEASMDAFYMKIVHFMGFLRVQIHSLECQHFVTLQSISSGRGAA